MLFLMGGLIGGGLVIFTDDVSQVAPPDFSPRWFWYRIGVYALVFLLWGSVCRYIIHVKVKQEGLSDKDLQERVLKRERDLLYLIHQRWKVLIFFFVFELVVVRQFGL